MWRVFAPRDGTGPAKWWLWVFLGPDLTGIILGVFIGIAALS
jgi:transposase